MQAKHAPPHTVISNALQTNGTLLNERWAAFFKRYRFLIGISLDGPARLHDHRRVDARGGGSFDRVMTGISHLRRHGVDFNILTVIHQDNVGKARELFRFYEQEKFGFVQFISFVEKTPTSTRMCKSGMNRCLFVVRKTNVCAIMDINGLRG
ncbi:radical SAM protein, partial [Cohnella sp.]|uniref:radical SAM protein n=1 Tax=Cohnella sp. TaxID=1883426 RepID=UPI003562ADC2